MGNRVIVSAVGAVLFVAAGSVSAQPAAPPAPTAPFAIPNPTYTTQAVI
jgi:hypothetical protein